MARKRLMYLVLDCETATLPFADEIAKNQKEKQTIAISKPLIYDIGWVLMYRNGEIIKRQNYLISEIYAAPSVFNTAYYKEKRGIYTNKIKEDEIKLATWRQAAEELEKDLSLSDYVGAYNSAFDFKKAIPFTERYISFAYSALFNQWLEGEKRNCIVLLQPKRSKQNKEFNNDKFIFRGKEYPLFDVWGMACKSLLNNRNYKQLCLNNGYLANSGEWFKTSAETSFRYLVKNYKFEEAHTALDDAEIEAEILAHILKRNKLEIGIEVFPFKLLDDTLLFIQNSPKTKQSENAEIIVNQMKHYLGDTDFKDMNNYQKKLYNKMIEVMKYI